MPELDLILDGEGRFPELEILGTEATRLRVAGLSKGMKSGRASVLLALDLPSGRVVYVQTSLRLFGVAADALRAKYPDGQNEKPRKVPSSVALIGKMIWLGSDLGTIEHPLLGEVAPVPAPEWREMVALATAATFED